MPIKPSPLTYLFLFDHALDQEIGIAFTISGVRREYFRNELYKCRKVSGDPRYDDLILFTPNAPNDNEIWICKKAVEIDDASPIR
jgi:hypothetical protein